MEQSIENDAAIRREVEMFHAVEGVLEQAGVPEFSTLADKVVDAVVACESRVVPPGDTP